MTCAVSLFGCLYCGDISIVHIPFVVSRVPCKERLVSEWCSMWMLDEVSLTSYSLSQNCPRDNRALFRICGKM